MPDRAAPPPFHLAVTVDDLAEAEAFYAGLLGAGIGRRGERWIDFDLAGHQVVAHLDPGPELARRKREAEAANPVDGDGVPVPHFGLVLDLERWHELAGRLTAAGVPFVLEPRIRFAGRPGEQGTFFLRDPAGNALEFKGLRDPKALFSR